MPAQLLPRTLSPPAGSGEIFTHTYPSIVLYAIYLVRMKDSSPLYHIANVEKQRVPRA